MRLRFSSLYLSRSDSRLFHRCTLHIHHSYQQIKHEIDPERLFAPINGKGKAERALVEEHFEVNYTHRFNVGRITRAGKYEWRIYVSRDFIV